MLTLGVESLGKRLKSARVELGMTQLYFAETIDASLQVVKDWEAGRRTPPLDRLIEIAHALRKPVGWFFEESEDGAPQPLPAVRTPKIGVGDVRDHLERLEGRLERIEAMLERLLQAQEDARLDAEADAVFKVDAFGRPYDDPSFDSVPEEVRQQRRAARMPPGSRKKAGGKGI